MKNLMQQLEIRRTVWLAIAAASMAALHAPTLSAHHGWSIYQEGFQLEGVVRKLNLGNAHDQLVVADADGNLWDVLLAPPQRNRSAGFDENSLEVGDAIKLHGQRHRNAKVFEMKIEAIEQDGRIIYRYPQPGRGR